MREPTRQITEAIPGHPLPQNVKATILKRVDIQRDLALEHTPQIEDHATGNHQVLWYRHTPSQRWVIAI